MADNEQDPANTTITLQKCSKGCKHQLAYTVQELNLGETTAFFEEVYVVREFAKAAGDDAPAGMREPDIRRVISLALGEEFDDEVFIDRHLTIPAYLRLVDLLWATNEWDRGIDTFMPAMAKSAGDFLLAMHLLRRLQASSRQRLEGAQAQLAAEGQPDRAEA